MSLILQTERLILRPFRDRDAPAFCAYRSEPQAARFQSWTSPFSLEKAKKFIDELKVQEPFAIGEWYQIAIENRQTCELMGDCAFNVLAEDPRQLEIGYTLSEKHQGQGFVTEALQALLNEIFIARGYHRVRAVCQEDNEASARLLKRLGFRLEGHFLKNSWFKGRWTSELWFGQLRAEWLSRHA